jgi:hypothetical protein
LRKSGEVSGPFTAPIDAITNDHSPIAAYVTNFVTLVRGALRRGSPSEDNLGTLTARESLRHMNDDSQQPDDRWNWLMIGLIVGAVVVALYGPLVWEITRGA